METDGEKSNGSMVFYCGPSNKSVDVVGREYTMINTKADAIPFEYLMNSAIDFPYNDVARGRINVIKI